MVEQFPKVGYYPFNWRVGVVPYQVNASDTQGFRSDNVALVVVPHHDRFVRSHLKRVECQMIDLRHGLDIPNVDRSYDRVKEVVDAQFAKVLLLVTSVGHDRHPISSSLKLF